MLAFLFQCVIEQRVVMRYRNLVFTLFSLANIFAFARVIEKTSAVIDDEMIFLSEVKAYRRLLSSSLAPSSVLFQLQSKKELLRSRRKLVDFMIDEKVLKSQLPEDQLSVSSREEILRRELKRKKISKRRLKKKLLKMGFSLEEYQDVLYYNDLFEKWIHTEISAGIQVLETDINDYYRMKTGKNFFTRYKYNLNQWNFDFSKKGKTSAERFSRQTEKKAAPSQTISFTEKQMNRDLREIISKMSVGQFSKPVCFGSHCYVFELLQRSFLVSDQRKANQLRSKIFQERFLSKFKSWMKNKRADSIIKKYT